MFEFRPGVLHSPRARCVVSTIRARPRQLISTVARTLHFCSLSTRVATRAPPRRSYSAALSLCFSSSRRSAARNVGLQVTQARERASRNNNFAPLFLRARQPSDIRLPFLARAYRRCCSFHFQSFFLSRCLSARSACIMRLSEIVSPRFRFISRLFF